MGAAAMRFDDELAELAALLRIGAKTARTIAQARGLDEDAIHNLAAQADGIAVRIDAIIGGAKVPEVQPADALRLRRDK